MKVSADYRTWSFRLRSDAVFHNRRPLRGQDVVFSLQRCAGLAEWKAPIEDVVVREESQQAQGNIEWVDVRLPAGSTAELRGFPAALAACPILEKHSSQLFEKDLGAGTNLIAAGDYAVSSFKAGGEIELARFRARHTGEGGDTIILRSFESTVRALSALRGGTLDALFLGKGLDIPPPADDPTIVPARCLGFDILIRRGLEFPCQGSIDISAVRYKS